MNKYLFSVDLLFFVSLYLLSSIESLSYRDLENIEFENCPLKNRCSQIGRAAFNERVCECDISCRTFGDCCIDVARSNSRNRPRQTCMHYGNFTYQGVYVFNTCSNGYLGPDEVILQCMNNNFSDPFVSAPVTDTSSGKTFLNQYCAICNDVSPASMKLWKVYLVCDDSNLDTNSLSWNNIKYRPDVKQWGYERQGRFSPCKFIYDKPSSVSVMARLCRPNLVSSCPSSWTQQTNRRECESYMAVVTDISNKAYKNPHCALCNGVDSTELMCLLPGIVVRAKVNFSLALLMDVNPSNGDVVGEYRSAGGSCPQGKKYDPYTKQCRTLGCAIPGYTARNGKCVKQ